MTIKTFTINLDNHPKERWNEIIEEYECYIEDYVKFIDSALIDEFGYFLGSCILPIFFNIVSFIYFILYDNEYIQEIVGISEKTKNKNLTFPIDKT